MKSGGYLARLAARAATPAVAPQPILFHSEIAAPGVNPAPPSIPQEIALAPPALADAASAPAPITGAPSPSRPLAGPAAPVPTPPDVAGQETLSPLPRAQMDPWRLTATERRGTRPPAPWDESALRGLDSSDRSSSRPIPQPVAASVASPLREASQPARAAQANAPSQPPARVAQAATPPPQPATLTRPAIEPDTLRSPDRPPAIPLTEQPAPPRPPEQPPRKSEPPEGAAARREPIEAELSPSLEALERVTGLWQARAARQPSREPVAARATTVTIGTLEVRVGAPPTPALVPAPGPAPANPPVPLARGFRVFGMRQS